MEKLTEDNAAAIEIMTKCPFFTLWKLSLAMKSGDPDYKHIAEDVKRALLNNDSKALGEALHKGMFEMAYNSYKERE